MQVILLWQSAYRSQLSDAIWCSRLPRLTSYRQFTYWIHRKLGKGVRRVIPACVVSSIRRQFPEENGEYVGSLTGKRLLGLCMKADKGQTPLNNRSHDPSHIYIVCSWDSCRNRPQAC